MIRKIPEGHGLSHLLSFPFSQHLSESEPEHGHRSGNSYGISNRLSQENCKDIIFHKYRQDVDQRDKDYDLSEYRQKRAGLGIAESHKSLLAACL